MGDSWADDAVPTHVEEQKVPDAPVDLKKRRGRPKGSKGKLNLKIQRIAQEETQND